MAINLKDQDNTNEIPNAEDMSFGILVSEWNSKITNALLQGAKETLLKHGAREENIFVRYVPGSFELVAGAKYFAQYTLVEAVIVLGCVIQGETRHFDYVCQGVTQGITDLNLNQEPPVIFGVLTTNNQEQAEERAGGKKGNKGIECAEAAIKMVALQNDFVENSEMEGYISDLWEYDNSDDEFDDELNEFEDDFDDDLDDKESKRR